MWEAWYFVNAFPLATLVSPLSLPCLDKGGTKEAKGQGECEGEIRGRDKWQKT